jgi:hypothetical protein
MQCCEAVARSRNERTRDRCYDFKNIFAEKLSHKMAVLTQNKAKFRKKKLIITLVLEKTANFFAENWEKSQKIVIITSTPGERVSPSHSRPDVFAEKLSNCLT